MTRDKPSTLMNVHDPRENMRRRRAYMNSHGWVEKYIFPVEPEPQAEEEPPDAEERAVAAKRITSFCRGSMKRVGLMHTCYVTGLSFPWQELMQFEVRKKILRGALSRAGIPEHAYSFHLPEHKHPEQVFTPQQLTDEWHEDANAYNASAIASYKKTMTSILEYAEINKDGHPSLGDAKGRDYINRTISNCMDAIKQRTAQEARRPGPLPDNWHFPTAAERRKMFRDADQNGNGRLSLFEVDALIKRKWPQFNSKQAILRAYKLADASSAGRKDGFIERNDIETQCEFTRFLKYCNLYTKYWHEFYKLDIDGDGKVAVDEWLQKGKAVFGSHFSHLSDEEMMEIFADIDYDNSGRVSYDEFCAWAAKLLGDKDICPEQAEKNNQQHQFRPSRMKSFARARKTQSWKIQQDEESAHGWSDALASAGLVNSISMRNEGSRMGGSMNQRVGSRSGESTGREAESGRSPSSVRMLDT